MTFHCTPEVPHDNKSSLERMEVRDQVQICRCHRSERIREQKISSRENNLLLERLSPYRYKTIYNSMILFIILISASLVEVRGFGSSIITSPDFPRTHSIRRVQSVRINAMDGDDDEEEYLERESDEEDEDIADFGEDDLQVAGVVIEDLNWRVEKLRLEEANKRRFLKAKPVFLPYEDACKWVQAWGQRWMSSEDWYVQSLISACGFVLV